MTHIPGHVGTEETANGGAGTPVSQLVGQTLFDLNTGTTYSVRQVTFGSPPKTGYRLVDSTGKLITVAAMPANLTLVNSLGIGYSVPRLPVVGDINVSTRTLPQWMLQPSGGGGGAGSGGGAAPAPAFSSTQAAQELAARQAAEAETVAFSRQRQLDIEAAERQRQRDIEAAAREAEAARLRAENEKLMQARSDLRAIAETASAIRAREREGLRGLYAQTQTILGETLGKDVVRGAIRGQGGLTRGVTPMQGYRTGVGQTGAEAQRLLQELSGELPAANLNAPMAETQQQIEQFQALAQPRDLPQLPTPGPLIGGLEHGGEIGKKGEVTPYGDRPEPHTALMMAESMGLTPRIVGERSGGPELALLARGSKVIPLSDDEETELAGQVQGAQAGFGGLGSYTFDPSTVSEQALAPVWEHLGFKQAPFFRRMQGETGSLTAQGWGSPEAFARLGVRPRLLRDWTTGATFWRDPSGALRHIPGPTFFGGPTGFRWDEAVNVMPADLAGERFGAELTELPPLVEPGVSRRRFPPSGAPRIIEEGPEGLRGLAIPAPRTMASLIRNVSASTRSVILSALGLVDYSPEDIEEEIRFFTPGGTARAPRAALLA